ncbi:hypothetical protein [Pyxidicoccus trucidator]|uniref:hypothetical protein n=1 Tax=Pyxidicoccus trucidator TaxID=2709662 RepID=UPI001966E20E|nr:hypothetical protein [Pyxidicoccus trucidator]
MEARGPILPEDGGGLPDIPIPGVPPEYWQHIRLGPLSGRYSGPGPSNSELDLRVDIDPSQAHSPVMNRISGDFYRVFRASLPGRPAYTWRNYLESWIVDAPHVTRFINRVVVTGTVRFWRGSHSTTELKLVIPWAAFSPAGPAEATFTSMMGTPITYHCARRSSAFRELQLEIDVCKSVNREPLLPSCDTHAHGIHPDGLPRRTLTFESVYREAGVEVKLMREGGVLDDSTSSLSRWSPAELHDAMETHYSQYGKTWPAWRMWGLMAGTFDEPAVGGIMFDAAAAFGGAGEAPERQGFALFRDHTWFRDLVPGVPSTQAQAAAMRHFLYTYIHEAGHAFNFLHSWNKSRPDSLSWMNYDWRYDQRNGPDSFWGNFLFRFDDDELLHLRHGDRAAVIMGGDPWSSGGHLEAPAEAMTLLEGDAPVELRIRSREVFDFMEPVTVELRLRNLLPDLPLEMDTLLQPEQGGVTVFIRGPDGQLRTYSPVLCKLATPRMRKLMPRDQGAPGEDRYSEEVFLDYGSTGFYFDQPGEYLVRAVYQGTGDLLIPSNVHRLRVGVPRGREEDRRAQDFFTHAVGLSLYLGGSRSPFLRKGMDTLEDVADRYKDSPLGAQAALTVANSRARPFHRREDSRIVRTHEAEPEVALDLSGRALDVYRRQRSPAFNLTQHRVAEQRAKLLAGMERKDEAKQELTTLEGDLRDKGVNDVVLRSIREKRERL